MAGRLSARRKRRILSSRVEGTRLLVSAMRGLVRRPRVFIVASAVGYYGDTGEAQPTEDAPAGGGFLARVSSENEEAALAAEALGVRTLRLRIGVVLGGEGGALRLMLPLFRMGLGGRLGGGRQGMSWIHVEDLAALFARALKDEACQGAINAVVPEAVTNRDFSRALARAVGRPALLPVPAPLLKLLLGELGGVLLASQRASGKRLLALGFEFAHASLDSALGNIASQEGHVWTTEQWVPAPRAEAFRFCSDPGNLERLAPPYIHFRILAVSAPTLCPGATLDYSLRLHGVPFRWQTRIEDWQPDEWFSDCQSRGPYTFWHHRHEFHEKDGGTLIRDRAHYKIPLGAAGDLFLHPFIRADLEKIFGYRRDQIAELLRGPL